jgi:flagellar M-ring protein FliF
VNFQNITDQLRRMTSSLSLAQKVSIPLAALVVAASLFTFSRWRHAQDFKPLFTGMSAEDAGAVVQKLKEANTEYRVAENGSIVLVPSAAVSESRIMLASAGLPKSGRIGFELFDKTNLSTTDFAEQVNFRRALEGELERTIRSVTEVQEARVHLTFPKDSVFIESRQPAKASVLLRLRPGANITPANVVAITHLMASAVDGLAPDAVAIMDVNGNLLSRKKSSPEVAEASDELIEYRQKLERDLLEKANATLEPLVGSGRYRIGLSVDCDFSSGEQSDEVYDPEKSVMVTSQKSEETNTAATSGGVPGTASNLPRPAPRTAGAGTAVSRRTENISWQSSRTIRKVRLPQGTIRRISASVLLDQAGRWEKQQSGAYQHVLEPPSPESLRAIKELVSAAIGLVPSRGDQIVIESLAFEATRQAPPPGSPAAPQQAPAAQPAMHLDWRVWVAAGGGVLLLALAAFALTRFRRSAKRPKVAVTSVPAVSAAPPAQSLPAPDPAAAVVAAAEATKMISEAQGAIVQTGRIEALIQQLRKGVAEDPTLAASVLRTWLAEARTR